MSRPRQFFTYDSLDSIRAGAADLSELGIHMVGLIDLVERDDLSTHYGWETTRSQLLHNEISHVADSMFAAYQRIGKAIEARQGDRETYGDGSGRYLQAGTIGAIRSHLDRALRARKILQDLSLFYLRNGWMSDGLATVQQACDVAGKITLSASVGIIAGTAGVTAGEPLRREQRWHRNAVPKEIEKALRSERAA